MEPLEAICVYCLWCSDSTSEVIRCKNRPCSLWHFRLGHVPDPGKKDPLKAIRLRCLLCAGGSVREVERCDSVTCTLHPFRMGTR